ncbi:hypothetical protein F6B67_08075 [Vibrio cholerae]|nr:hypothetical protein [Vibrio cholerae]EGQ9645180.1 hypothetical protein [Vibrio cholerae]
METTLSLPLLTPFHKFTQVYEKSSFVDHSLNLLVYRLAYKFSQPANKTINITIKMQKCETQNKFKTN